jgi:hypothetical protein
MNWPRFDNLAPLNTTTRWLDTRLHWKLNESSYTIHLCYKSDVIEQQTGLRRVQVRAYMDFINKLPREALKGEHVFTNFYNALGKRLERMDLEERYELSNYTLNRECNVKEGLFPIKSSWKISLNAMNTHSNELAKFTLFIGMDDVFAYNVHTLNSNYKFISLAMESNATGEGEEANLLLLSKLILQEIVFLLNKLR